MAAAARQASPSRQPQGFTVISSDNRRPLNVVAQGDQVMVSLEDLASLFQLTVREDPINGTVSVVRKNKSVLLTPGQKEVSAAGRLVSLPAPLTRDGKRYLVPIEFVARALPAIAETKLEVRKASRLVLVGDVRVPRLTVSADPIGTEVRLTVEITPRTPQVVSLESGRLLVRFDADALDTTLPSPPAQGPLTGLHAEGNVLALDLGPRFGSFRSSVVPVEGNATQLVLDLFATGGENMPLPGAARPTAPATPAPPEPVTPVPGLGSTFHTIVLDAGHGGDETGAKGSAGAVEKDLTLALAKKLRAALESRLGVRVLLTRDGDQTVPLDDRAALANNNKADLFISLHANASLRPDVSGAEVFYLSTDQTGDEARRAAATRQTLPALGGGTREIEMILWEMAQVRHVNESAALAASIEAQLKGRIRMNPRPVQQAPFRVLAGANMPAVLVEVGFLTNPDEEQQLQSDTYQATLVQALLDAVVQFRDALEHGLPQAQPPGTAAPASPAAVPPKAGLPQGGLPQGSPRPPEGRR